MTDLITRVEQLETRFALERLISEYAHAFDTRDETLLRSIWHEEARLDLGAAFGCHDGIAAIIASAHLNWAAMPHMHHWMANPLIDIRGDTASATVAVDCLCTHNELGQVQISGLYHDRFERRQERWAFSERRFELHFLTPLAGWKPLAGLEA